MINVRLVIGTGFAKGGDTNNRFVITKAMAAEPKPGDTIWVGEGNDRQTLEVVRVNHHSINAGTTFEDTEVWAHCRSV